MQRTHQVHHCLTKSRTSRLQRADEISHAAGHSPTALCLSQVGIYTVLLKMSSTAWQVILKSSFCASPEPWDMGGEYHEVTSLQYADDRPVAQHWPKGKLLSRCCLKCYWWNISNQALPQTTRSNVKWKHQVTISSNWGSGWTRNWQRHRGSPKHFSIIQLVALKKNSPDSKYIVALGYQMTFQTLMRSSNFCFQSCMLEDLEALARKMRECKPHICHSALFATEPLTNWPSKLLVSVDSVGGILKAHPSSRAPSDNATYQLLEWNSVINCNLRFIC